MKLPKNSIIDFRENINGRPFVIMNMSLKKSILDIPQLDIQESKQKIIIITSI